MPLGEVGYMDSTTSLGSIKDQILWDIIHHEFPLNNSFQYSSWFLFFIIIFFYNPNFCLGCPFRFSTYRVSISYLPLGSLEAHVKRLLLPYYRV